MTQPAPDTFEYLPVPLNRDDDVYPVAKGITYRATVSVSKDYAKAQISGALASRGWGNISLWDTGDALPADWPNEDLSSGLEANHRWLRGEATRTGPADTLDRVSTAHVLVTIHLSIYRIAAFWKKVPHPSQGLVIGPGSGPNGLDAQIPPPIAAAIVEAWSYEGDPQKLRELAATMRQGGLPIASNVLDQRALTLESQGVLSPAEQSTQKSRAGGAVFFASLLATLGGLLTKARGR